jgi:putative radical SAM enzyme (TIGR03279 family)
MLEGGFSRAAMTVRIDRVEGKSGFFRPGDEIVAIGSRPVEDQLDALFLTAGEGKARFTILRGGRRRSRTLRFAAFARARVIFDPMRFMPCRSKCIFCFMDQMPAGMRPSLYEKDDDFRLSFLFGNFITLNDVRERDLQRIIQLRLSPLYVSVHAVRGSVRERLFGRPMRRNVLADLHRLARAGIVMHAQIVLVPGVNDGASLRETVRELAALYPACRSVAIVPVGVTMHRTGLPRLRRVTVAESRKLLDWAERERARLKRRTGGDCVLHLADEFYLATNRVLPSVDECGDFPQLANGVGACRSFLMQLERDIEFAKRRRKVPRSVTVATGVLGARFLRRYAAPLIAERLPSLSFRIIVVRNRLFGPAVTVSGLLSGRDIIRSARRNSASGCLVIPPSAVNHEGRFIDDLKVRDMERELGIPVIVAHSTFLENRVALACRKECSR